MKRRAATGASEEIDESPVPDPTANEPHPDDDPEAD